VTDAPAEVRELELWFAERDTPDMEFSLRVRETLHREKTRYQDVAVLDTYQFGRMLVLDGIVQTTEKDEFIYHEMIAHVPLFTHPAPRTVLIIGGGDGGAAREALKHSEVERVDLVEIDRRVVEIAREYLPSIACAYDDERLNLIVGDGIEHARKADGDYDVIIVDSTDPVGPAVGLFTEEFYRSAHEALAEEGVMVAQTESPFTEPGLIERVYKAVAEVFPVARFYLADVPTYPCGTWGFTLGSKVHDPVTVPEERIRGVETSYYSPAVHRRSFLLPPFVQRIIE